MYSFQVHIPGHKTSLKNYKNMEIISNIFSNHNSIKLENHRKRNKKKIIWRLNNMLLKHQ